MIITEVVSPMVSGQYLSDFSMTDTELSPDSEYESTKCKKSNNPCNGDTESSVDRKPLKTPPTGHHSTQGLARICLRQDIADVSERIEYLDKLS